MRKKLWEEIMTMVSIGSTPPNFLALVTSYTLHLIICVVHPFLITHCCVIYIILHQAVKFQLNITYCKVIWPKASGLMERSGRGIKKVLTEQLKNAFSKKNLDESRCPGSISSTCQKFTSRIVLPDNTETW